MSKFEEVNGELVCFLTDEDLSGADYKAKADRYEKRIAELESALDKYKKALREIVAFCNVTCELPAKMQKIATDALEGK